jgi:hypothetical protein
MLTTLRSGVLWRPTSFEAKACVYRSWFAVVGFDLGNWALGFGFDVAPTGFWINLGPLSVGAEREEPPPESYDDLPDWSWTLRRIVIQKWKLETRLELDLNIWKFGYVMGDVHDHGLYFGPFNVQIEYDKFYNDPMVRSDDLYEYANLYPRATGLPMTVWVPLRSDARRQALVRVNTRHGPRMTIAKTAVVSVHPTPHVISGRLTPADRQVVFEWISLNTDPLLAFWEGQIGSAEFAYKLKPVGPHLSDIPKPIWHVRSSW